MDTTTILKELQGLDPKTFAKVEIILRQVLDHPRLDISEYNTILVDGGHTGVKIESFLYNLEIHNKKIPKKYFPVLGLLKLSEHLIPNKYAKTSSWVTV